MIIMKIRKYGIQNEVRQVNKFPRWYQYNKIR